MKRCIICGNMGENDSKVCPVCGNPYLDLEEDSRIDEYDIEEQPVSDEVYSQEEVQEDAQDQKTEEAAAEDVAEPEESAADTEKHPEKQSAEQPDQGEAAESKAQRPRTGAPHVYGQQGKVPEQPTGAFRRDIAGGSPVKGANMQRRPGNVQGIPGNGQRRPGNVQGVPGNMQRRPGNVQGVPGSMQRRPGNMQGGPAADQARSMAYRKGEIMRAAKKQLHSPLFVLITLLQTAALGGSVAAIFMKQLNFSQVMHLITNIPMPMQLTGYSDQLLKLMAKLDTDAAAANLALLLPDLLLCLGLWIMLFASFSRKPGMAGAGFGLAKAKAVLSLVKNGALMIAGLVVSVALVVSAWVSESQAMIIASVITLVIMIIATMLVIMYAFSYIATMNTLRANAANGESYGRVSGYVAVVHVLAGLFSIIGLLSGIVNSEISGIVGSGAKVVWMILFAVWIFRYRAKLSAVED